MEERSVQRALFITYDGLTDPLGQSQIIPYLKGIARSGVNITILSAEKKEREGAMKHVESQLADSGIKWHHIKFRTGIYGKLSNLFSMRRKALELCRSEKFDLIHCRSYVAAVIGLQMKRKFQLPFLFDIRGFWIDERVERGIWNLRNPGRLYAYYYYRNKEKSLYRQAAGIITLTHSSAGIVHEKFGIPKGRITVIPCSADFSVFYPLDPEEKDDLRSEMDILPGEFVLSYSGSVGGVYLIGAMLQFYKLVQAEFPDSWFLILTPEKKERILDACRESGVDPARVIVKYVDHGQINKYLNVSDINIFLLKKSFSIEASMPTKLGEVWAAGIPVIANEISDLPVYFQGNVNGYLLKDINPSELKKAAGKITQLRGLDSGLIREIAMHNFNLEGAVEKYIQAYLRIFSHTEDI